MKNGIIRNRHIRASWYTLQTVYKLNCPMCQIDNMDSSHTRFPCSYERVSCNPLEVTIHSAAVAVLASSRKTLRLDLYLSFAFELIQSFDQQGSGRAQRRPSSENNTHCRSFQDLRPGTSRLQGLLRVHRNAVLTPGVEADANGNKLLFTNGQDAFFLRSIDELKKAVYRVGDFIHESSNAFLETIQTTFCIKHCVALLLSVQFF